MGSLVILNRLLQITCLMIRLRHKDNVNRLRRIPRVFAIFDVNVSIHRQSIRQNKQARFIYLVSFSSNYYRLSFFIPGIRSCIRFRIAKIFTRIRNILTILPISTAHIAERQLSCRLAVLVDHVAHMRLLRVFFIAFMSKSFATSKLAQTSVAILRRSFQQIKNLICIKPFCFSWVVAVNDGLVVFAPRKAFVGVAAGNFIILPRNVVIFANIRQTRELASLYIRLKLSNRFIGLNLNGNSIFCLTIRDALICMTSRSKIASKIRKRNLLLVVGSA